MKAWLWEKDDSVNVSKKDKNRIKTDVTFYAWITDLAHFSLEGVKIS